MKSAAEYADLIQFFAPGLLAAGAAAIGGSQVGTFVLLRREGMTTLALPQVVAVGAAIALRWGWNPLGPALATTAIAVLLLAWSRRRDTIHWLLPSLYVAGVSLSFLIIANAGAHVEEMQNMFTGMAVSVTWETASLCAPPLLIAGLACSLLWRRWLGLAQIAAASELAGVKPARWDALFLGLLAAVLLFSTSGLDAVMTLAMLFLPAATALPWFRRIPPALAAAAVMAILFLAAGFILSNEMDWPLSQSVGGVGFAALLLSHMLRAVIRKKHG